MDSFNKTEHKEKFSELIQSFFLSMDPIICWQNHETKGRVLHYLKMLNVDNESEEFEFSIVQSMGEITLEDSLFAFSEEHKVLFKASILSISETLKVKMPEDLKLLDDSDLKPYEGLVEQFKHQPVNGTGLDLDLDTEEGESPSVDILVKMGMSEHDADLFATELSYITLEQEDKIYEGMRAAPRAKPPEGKMVTVQVADESRPQSTLSLYDLSQGGLSFLVFAKEDFIVGEKILIKAFDINKFDKPMQAEVKVVREADDLGIQYKVGCQFLDLGSISE